MKQNIDQARCCIDIKPAFRIESHPLICKTISPPHQCAERRAGIEASVPDGCGHCLCVSSNHHRNGEPGYQDTMSHTASRTHGFLHAPDRGHDDHLRPPFAPCVHKVSIADPMSVVVRLGRGASRAYHRQDTKAPPENSAQALKEPYEYEYEYKDG